MRQTELLSGDVFSCLEENRFCTGRKGAGTKRSPQWKHRGLLGYKNTNFAKIWLNMPTILKV